MMTAVSGKQALFLPWAWAKKGCDTQLHPVPVQHENAAAAIVICMGKRWEKWEKHLMSPAGVIWVMPDEQNHEVCEAWFANRWEIWESSRFATCPQDPLRRGMEHLPLAFRQQQVSHTVWCLVKTHRGSVAVAFPEWCQSRAEQTQEKMRSLECSAEEKKQCWKGEPDRQRRSYD